MPTRVKTAGMIIREVSLNRVEGEEKWMLFINDGMGIPANNTEIWLWLELLRTRAELSGALKKIGELQSVVDSYEEFPR